MLTHERLLQVVRYNPETGVWVWRASRYPIRNGTKAALGLDDKGYHRIKIDGTLYRAGRLAFFYMMRKWPIQIDHIDGNRGDDRWINLREATCSENCRNRKVRRDSTTGAKGATRNQRTFIARVGGRYLGCFATAEDAHRAYWKAAREDYGDFAREK